MDRIRQLRTERGLSQAKLAVMADMDPATLNRLEQGKGNPNLRTLQRVADALNVEVAELLGKAPAPPSQRSLFNDAIAEERRAPSLQGWTALVDRLSDRWEQEIKRRNDGREAAEPRVSNHVNKLLLNLNWANEIRATAGDIVTIASDELEVSLGMYTSDEALALFRALKRIDAVVDSAEPWFASVAKENSEKDELAKARERKAARKAAIERTGRRLDA